MNITSDVMGSACDWIEENVGGVALFMNSDAGDINPSKISEKVDLYSVFGVACVGGPVWSGGKVIGAAVQQVRNSLNPSGILKSIFLIEK